MTLDQVEPGMNVRVVKIGGNPVLRRRLLEMGLVRGSTICVERLAPLRDPIQIRVKGASVALRTAESRYIVVETERDAS